MQPIPLLATVVGMAFFVTAPAGAQPADFGADWYDRFDQIKDDIAATMDTMKDTVQQSPINRTQDTVAGDLDWNRTTPDAQEAERTFRVSKRGDGRVTVEAHLGAQPTDGYNVSITDITVENGTATVDVSITHPREDDTVTQQVTYPADAVTFPGTAVETVEFDLDETFPVSIADGQ